MRFLVGPASEFPIGERRIVRVGGREIGVFHTEQGFFAVRNRCPHQGAPLCHGKLVSRVTAQEPGAVEIADSPPLVVCPWHRWQYDALTGEAYAPEDAKVRTYGVSVDAGAGLADDEGIRFVAETFPVSVQDNYVVLEA